MNSTDQTTPAPPVGRHRAKPIDEVPADRPTRTKLTRFARIARLGGKA